jgi:hypothetical protein
MGVHPDAVGLGHPQPEADTGTFGGQTGIPRDESFVRDVTAPMFADQVSDHTERPSAADSDIRER